MAVDSRSTVAEGLLRARGADGFEHPGGTLFAHLGRVQMMLAEWGAGEEIQLAGLCHAAYGTDVFDAALFPLNERPVLTEAIGPEAEALVYLYGSCDRRQTYPELTKPLVTFTDRFSGIRHMPPRSSPFARLWRSLLPTSSTSSATIASWQTSMAPN